MVLIPRPNLQCQCLCDEHMHNSVDVDTVFELDHYMQGGAFEEPTPQLDEHYLYSLKDFQPFESDTYDGQCIILVHNL